MTPEQRQRRHAIQRRYYERMHPDMGDRNDCGAIKEYFYNGCNSWLKRLTCGRMYVTGWLKGDIEKERMEEIKRQIEMG